jgi:large subunit ribosomal protein L9
MDVILLEKVDNLGALGDVVKVRAGYARNYLVPRGKAKYATAANLAEFEARRAELEKIAAEHLAAAEARKAQLEGREITVTAKAGGEGKLFGSVGPGDIVRALEEAGLEVERKELRMPEGPIRTAGEFEIELHLYTDVNATIKLTVVAEE